MFLNLISVILSLTLSNQYYDCIVAEGFNCAAGSVADGAALLTGALTAGGAAGCAWTPSPRDAAGSR